MGWEVLAKALPCECGNAARQGMRTADGRLVPRCDGCGKVVHQGRREIRWPDSLRREMATTGIKATAEGGRVVFAWLDGGPIMEWDGRGNPGEAFERCCSEAERLLGLAPRRR